MHQVSPTTTAVFVILLVVMILSLAFEEKIHAKKSVIVGWFAVITLFLAAAFGLIYPETVQILGHPVTLPVYIPGIDWEVIAIILGSSLFVDVTSKCGLFTWIAIKLTKASKGDPRCRLSRARHSVVCLPSGRDERHRGAARAQRR